MRRTVVLNRDWRYTRGDPPGAQVPRFDDSGWQRVGLPHSFDLPYFRTPEFYVGYGWYRRALDVPGEWLARRVFLEFDGAFQVAEVYVNGRRAVYHRGGYTGFSVDITETVVAGANLIAVRVNNLWDARTSPRAGEHVFGGGIYRDVRLVVKDRLHVTWNGVATGTPLASTRDNAGVVAVETEVFNGQDQEVTCILKTDVIDQRNEVVGDGHHHAMTMAPGGTATFRQHTPPFARPRLWHPDHPHLYQVWTRIYAGGDGDGPADEVVTPFGFRWFEWTADRGFFLNGAHLYLRGANAHQDRAGWGIAATRSGCERDVRLIKDAGFNFVRGAHYPHHPAFAEACDRLGLLLLPENCFWGKGGFGPEGYWNASAFPPERADWGPFREQCKRTLAEMIRRDRNHPSVVGWSMTNEAFFTYHVEEAKGLVRELVALSHELDPTRPAVIGGAQRGGFDRLGDVAAYNGDGARLFIDPGVPNLVSEYGAISKPVTAYEPFWGELQRERFAWRAGEAIWCGFDYGSIAGKQGLKGIVDHFRLPKRSWHWYREHNLGIAPPDWPGDAEPAALVVGADKTVLKACDGTDDCQIVVTVHDAAGRRVRACPVVTLSVVEGPGEFPTGRSITFDPTGDIAISEGRAGMEFRSYHAGRSVVRATSPGLAPAEVAIVTEGEDVYVEGATPAAEDRPYAPPQPSEQAIRSLRSVVNVAKDRPSRASGEAPGHPARHANDGDSGTTWVAGEARAGAWWEVDLEGFYQVSRSRVTFGTLGGFDYKIELSDDRTNWSLAVDRRQSEGNGMTREDVYPPGATARYLRVTLSGMPAGARAALADVEVHGILAPR